MLLQRTFGYVTGVTVVESKGMSNNEVEFIVSQAKSLYQHRDFAAALRAFETALDVNSNRWDCKLYAAMCYYKLGNVNVALSRFKSISEQCTIKEIKIQAETAMSAIQKDALQVTVSDLGKLPGKASKAPSTNYESDDEEVEWQPKGVRNYT